MILTKGSGYNAEYASADFPTLTADWTGSVSFYTTYPGTATFTKALTLSGNKLLLALTVEEILNLGNGVYYFVTTLANTVLGVSITQLDYATVTPALAVGGTPMCVISMTIGKVDGTPAGRETTTLVTTVNGTAVQLGWSGVPVTASHQITDVVSGVIIGNESITTTTNAAGYAQLSVIKGQTVVISCPSLSTTQTVNTAGFDTLDLGTLY